MSSISPCTGLPLPYAERDREQVPSRPGGLSLRGGRLPRLSARRHAHQLPGHAAPVAARSPRVEAQEAARVQVRRASI